MKNRYFYVFLMLLLFAGLISGCFFDDDDVKIIVDYNPENEEIIISIDPGDISNDTREIISGWHNNIICTNFSILLDEDDLSSGQSAFMETTEINPYYFALPYNNRTYKYYYDKGYRPPEGYSDSLLRAEVKNRWVEIINNSNQKTVYCQWEDVGPWFFEDFAYVFSALNGSEEIRPKAEQNIGQNIDKGQIYSEAGVRNSTVSDYSCNGAGIDISPTAMEYLTGSRSGKIYVKWRFVDEETALNADTQEILWAASVNRNPAPKRSTDKKGLIYNNLERATKCQ